MQIRLIAIILVLVCSNCGDADSCSECNQNLMETGTGSGVIFNEVTTDNVSKFGLADSDIGSCVRYRANVDGSVRDNSVVAVDDCCCD